MTVRIGKVTNTYPSQGKIKVLYEDEGNTSLPLPMLTMNREYSMPSVGDRVVVLHMENGSSKGVILGTYYGGSMQPQTDGGYRKDFEGGAYAACSAGDYLLSAKIVSIKAGDGSCTGATIDLGKEITVEAEQITLKCPYGEITVEDIMKRVERIENQLGLPHTI